MATLTPVAFRTRSRLRKRKVSLLKGFSPNRKSNKGKTEVQKENSVTSANSQPKKSRPVKIGMDKTESDATENLPESTKPLYEESDSIAEEDDVDNKSGDTSLSSSSATTSNAETGEASIIVLNASELAPLEDPTKDAEKMLELITSSDWLEQYEGITLIRRYVNYNTSESDFLTSKSIEKILSFLKTGVESLRSAQSRNALFAISELFEHVPDLVLASQLELDGVLDAVVLKCVNDKRFIAAAGEAVLESMVVHAPSLEILMPLLRHSSSKSAKIGGVIAKYSLRCLRGLISPKPPQKEGAFKVLENEENLHIIVRSFNDLESGRSVEAKKPSQDAFRLLSGALHPEKFESLVRAALTPADASRVLIIVRKSTGRETKKPSLREMMAEKRKEMSMKTSGGNSISHASISSTDSCVKKPAKLG